LQIRLNDLSKVDLVWNELSEKAKALWQEARADRSLNGALEGILISLESFSQVLGKEAEYSKLCNDVRIHV
jgi:hypothetical protein